MPIHERRAARAGRTAVVALVATGCVVGPVASADDSRRDRDLSTLSQQSASSEIVVDQFGYLPESKKIAVVRQPRVGFDAAPGDAPGRLFAIVDARTGAVVQSGAAEPWNGGEVDPSSGDVTFRVDFSSLRQDGRFFVVDLERHLRSPTFSIGTDVYKAVLRAAVRTFFLQRAGAPKPAAFAGIEWADDASHLGPGQDESARLFDRSEDATTERDLRGGWYDAGDANKYTSWTAQYVVTLLLAFRENPTAFGDDYGIPESGNGIPDVIDEALWGVDWLARMQQEDGSVLSIVALDEASPPSRAKGPSVYGPANTVSALGAAAAFALAAQVVRSTKAADRADALLDRAKRAYAWADAHPDVIFRNNDVAFGSKGLGHGQQEVDDYGRLTRKLAAAVYLFDLTHDDLYRRQIDSTYSQTHLMEWGAITPYEADSSEALLAYAAMAEATPDVAAHIRGTFERAMEQPSSAAWQERDPYGAYIEHYTWGSNQVKALQGSLFTDLVSYGFHKPHAEIADTALGYLHAIHGVNPLGLTYLTNMGALGAERSVSSVFHFWFNHDSPRWSRVGASTFGPPPGFLVGGPNAHFDADPCCPTSCGARSVLCVTTDLTPPKGQPPQKAYKDFNDGWPLNSWAVAENSNGYQASYIRLLSKFVH